MKLNTYLIKMFYQIIKVKDKTIWFKELAQELTREHDMSGYTKPIPNKFYDRNPKVYKKIVTDPKYIKLSSFQWAQPWDGKEKYTSSYA